MLLLFAASAFAEVSEPHSDRSLQSIDFVSLSPDNLANNYCADIYRSRAMGKVYVSIIIDDMGLSKYSSNFIEFKPFQLSLSFLPYAENLSAQVQKTRENGHEIMLHMPMEPLFKKVDDPYLIRVSDDHDVSKKLLTEAIDLIPEASGINNHMGSKVTSSAQKMQALMPLIKQKGLYFVDSKTVSSSVAEKIALEMSVPTIGRDVFLDHAGDKKNVTARLHETASRAQKYGFALAIGHPSKKTHDALSRFAKDDMAQNLIFVSTGELIRIKDCILRGSNYSYRKSNLSDLAMLEHDVSDINSVMKKLFKSRILKGQQ